MKTKVLNFIVLGVLFILGIIYFMSIQSANSIYDVASYIGPDYLPAILVIILSILIMVSIFQNILNENSETRISNSIYIVLMIIATTAYIIIWKIIDSFYISSLLYTAGLIYINKVKDEGRKRSLFAGIVVAAFLVLFLFVLYSMLMGIRL